MNNFKLEEAIQILERTPSTLTHLLSGLSNDWVYSNEGENTWSPYDVIGHLIHGEKTDWIVRLHIILNHPDKQFEPFDRFAQFENSKGKNLTQLLNEFTHLRSENIRILQQLQLTDNDYTKTGIHPTFGTVTLGQLLATWVVHDLDHLYQISRTLAKRYQDNVGPWIEFLRILKQ